MLGIGDYFWRLIPANPILLRVVEAGGKRRRDLIVRCAYLGLLIFVVIFSLMTSNSSFGGMSLEKLAAASASLFTNMSYLQLALVALLSPIFTAGAITQEKDSQTYDILLSTPLTNGQIVLGSLLSRLFFVIALLISGIPIFSITQIFGGVAINDIVLSFGIAAATAFVTGSLAMAIAVFKVGTRRTIFSFYLFVVIYLVSLFLLDRLEFFHPVTGYQTNSSGQAVVDADGAPLPIHAATSYFTGLHPFLSLRVVLDPKAYAPPNLADLPETMRFWPMGWYLTSPHTFYINFMFFLSAVLILPSIVLLRRLAQSTVSFKSYILQKLHLSRGDRTRKPRYVWHNPIAWREAKTKASAARASLLRYGFIAAGVVGALILVYLFASVEMPDKYITRGSYDPIQQTLFINGDATYNLSPGIAVTLNGDPATVETLRGKLKVENFQTQSTLQGPMLTSVSLADIPRRIKADDARQFLLGAVIVEFAVILLIVTNAAASTVTREKEDGSLDLLLTTPITSRYYIWGKLRGLVSYVLPLVAVPVVSILIFILYDFFRMLGSSDTNFQWIIFPEAVLIMPGTLVIVAALASILGMQMSLRCRTTVRAVMSSVGIILGASAAMGWCGWALLTGTRSVSEIQLILSAFSPFTVLTVLIDPYNFGGGLFDSPTRSGGARFLLFLFSWAATGAYALIVWSMYKSMVKNFDMTIRRQSK